MNEKEALAWAKVSAHIGNFTNKQLHKLRRIAGRELETRHHIAEALNKRRAEGFRSLANFMAGVTWALACRAALRESKGHDPVHGKRPQSGEMWLPRELLYAVRHQVKQRGWHPITAATWTTVKDELLAEAAHAERKRHAERASFPAAPYQPVEAQTFRIPFAAGEARVTVDDRFDYGGES